MIIDVINGFSEDELIITKPGRIIPLYCSAIGRALLLDHTPEQMDDYFDNTTLLSHTPLTTTSREVLLEKLAQSRVRGYTFDPGELRPGIAGFGAPIRSSGHIIASISLAELSSILTQEAIHQLGNSVAETARKISKKL